MEKQMTQHAPGKLEIRGESSVCYGHGDYGSDLNLKIGDELICKVSDGYNLPPEWQQANAERIKLCWNTRDTLKASHDELAMAFLELIKTIESHPGNVDDRYSMAEIFEFDLSSARTALANAED